MSGSEHYALAAQHAEIAAELYDDGETARAEERVRLALVHVGLAQAAATALGAVLPLVGGDSAEVTAWARMIGALDDDARRDEVVEAVIYPECWPPIAGDAWSLTPPGADSWLRYTTFAQDTPDGIRMIPARVGGNYDPDAVVSPDELLRQGELKLLYRNPEEPPF